MHHRSGGAAFSSFAQGLLKGGTARSGPLGGDAIGLRGLAGSCGVRHGMSTLATFEGRAVLVLFLSGRRLTACLWLLGWFNGVFNGVVASLVQLGGVLQWTVLR